MPLNVAVSAAVRGGWLADTASRHDVAGSLAGAWTVDTSLTAPSTVRAGDHPHCAAVGSKPPGIPKISSVRTLAGKPDAAASPRRNSILAQVRDDMLSSDDAGAKWNGEA